MKNKLLCFSVVFINDVLHQKKGKTTNGNGTSFAG